MQEAKDWAQLVAWIAAIIGGWIAAQKAIKEMRASRQQREDELRWKQANSSKELISDIHQHPLACNAVHMMDWNEGTALYQIAPGNSVKIGYDAVLSALQKKQPDCLGEPETYIQDCFDWFFYYIDRIQHYIDRGLITFADVSSVFKPYAKKIGCEKKVYEKFMLAKHYDLALQFWNQYKEFKIIQAGEGSPPTKTRSTAAK